MCFRFFFFKQKTAYEMRISDWSSDVCSADLVGEKLRFRGSTWDIVGVFESGDAHESELWADVETTQASFFRSTFSSVLVQLRSADAFAGIKRRLTGDPQLNVDVQRERDYFSEQSQNFTNHDRKNTSLNSSP